MVKRKHIKKSLQEKYYDGEAEYIDERYVSSYIFEGLDDCIEYLNTYNDRDYWNEKENHKNNNYYARLKKEEIRFSN